MPGRQELNSPRVLVADLAAVVTQPPGQRVDEAAISYHREHFAGVRPSLVAVHLGVIAGEARRAVE
jgi:hypothetical protein